MQTSFPMMHLSHRDRPANLTGWSPSDKRSLNGHPRRLRGRLILTGEVLHAHRRYRGRISGSKTLGSWSRRVFEERRSRSHPEEPRIWICLNSPQRTDYSLRLVAGSILISDAAGKGLGGGQFVGRGSVYV